MTPQRLVSIASALCCLAAGPLLAQVPSQHGRIKATPRDPQYPNTTNVPDEPKQSIVLPSEPLEYGDDRASQSAGVIARIAPEDPRLPEGYSIANRAGRVVRSGKTITIQLADMPGLPKAGSLRVLPNTQLQLLETVLSERTNQPELLFSGRVTDFNGANYLLIESVTEGAAPKLDPDDTPKVTPDLPGGPGPLVEEHPDSATQAAGDTQPAREPTAEEVVKKLLESRPRRAVVLPEAPTTSAATQPAAENTGVAEGRKDPLRWNEETSLIDRPGRLIPSDDGWAFAFEDQGHTPGAKPIRVLPSQLLETAINLSGGGTRGVVLIVSGEVTVYRGTENLLLRKVLIRRDYGNFR